MPFFCFCSFRYYLEGGGGDVFPLLPPLKSRSCGFTYGPDFSSTASWWGLRLFFHGSIGDAILHTLLVHILFAEKGNLENACLCSLFFWLESSLLFTWDFFIFQAKMGAHFGWKQKIFHRANSFSFRKGVFFSLGEELSPESEISFKPVTAKSL